MEGTFARASEGTLLRITQRFLAACDEDSDFIQRLALVVIDNVFTGHSSTGIDLAGDMRKRFPDTRLVLSSTGFFSDHELDLFDLVLPKEIPPVHVLFGEEAAVQS